MNITLKPRPSFALKVGSGEIVFEQVSEWNGMLELRSPQHGVLIVAPHAQGVFEEAFGRIFDGLVPGAGELKYSVMKATPSLVALLRSMSGEPA